MNDEKITEQKQISDILEFVAPGTPFRDGIENVLRAKTGGLIVIGYNDQVKKMVDGGFSINCAFTPAHLYELAKMDGALILNDSGSKILFANAQLMPDPSTPSSQTGMRHRTAERVAKQSGVLVIAISQRRNVITLYKDSSQYVLKDISVILAKANQALGTLEKYKAVLDDSINSLSALEFEEQVTHTDVLQSLHRIEMVLRIKNEILSYISELGTEGRLIRLQMNELLSHLEEEAILLMKDYMYDTSVEPTKVIEKMQQPSNNVLLDDQTLLRLMGYPIYTSFEEGVVPRGYRMLHKIPRLPSIIIENLIEELGDLKAITDATVQELDEVEGIGEIRARKIQQGLKRLKEQHLLNRQL
ncbi:DNA integrity scanning protein DisA [Bacillus sp. VT 712]|uniref:DNA integrity scanning protein DisA n=1 Tax=Priestia veravalensis TaxID=1414648 RepID=A0A0V8JKX1_9BACI|nr:MULTISPECIES: DNA integrity scanning diadenylate cyclase DisA [Bacillaceae]KSU87714.1 DNA integrity scanning protein DisA [Priestia veravalensis]KZB91563.1 DNA integrity scanning protein DisA [Bacillus sp. VT 712]MEC0664595.1 DNA integrity scanning diadenylate cyclase DisA [Priestia flexa]SCC29820.1 diadenylate cyclase [Priestia flexa]